MLHFYLYHVVHFLFVCTLLCFHMKDKFHVSGLTFYKKFRNITGLMVWLQNHERMYQVGICLAVNAFHFQRYTCCNWYPYHVLAICCSLVLPFYRCLIVRKCSYLKINFAKILWQKVRREYIHIEAPSMLPFLGLLLTCFYYHVWCSQFLC